VDAAAPRARAGCQLYGPCFNRSRNTRDLRYVALDDEGYLRQPLSLITTVFNDT